MKTVKIALIVVSLLAFWNTPVFADFGCHFIVNDRLSTPITDGTTKLSFRFTCQEDNTLLAASLYCEDAQDPPGYLVSLFPDWNGVPGPEPLGVSSIVPNAKSWLTVPFSNIPLFAGKTYHLVVEQDKNRGGSHPVGVIGPQNYASFAYTDYPNHMTPLDELKEPKSDILLFDGKSWKSLNRQPLYTLHGGGFHTEGNPYDAFKACPIFKNSSGGVLQGEALHPHCHINQTGFAIRVRKQGHPTAPLAFQVYTNDYIHHITAFSYGGIALTPGQATASFQWVTIGLKREDMPKPFEPECTYIGFQSDSGSGTQEEPGCDDCYLISEVGNSKGLSGAAEASFDGGAHLSRAAYSTDGGKTWVDKFEWDANVVILGPNCDTGHIPIIHSIPTPLPLPKDIDP